MPRPAKPKSDKPKRPGPGRPPVGLDTERRRRFVAELIADPKLNATQAAIRAGFSENGAKQRGCILMKDPEIQAALKAGFDERAERTKIDADWVLKQAVELHLRCMQEVVPMTDRKGNQIRDDNGNPLYVFNANGAAKALEQVGKHIGVQAFKEKIEHDVNLRHEDALEELG